MLNNTFLNSWNKRVDSFYLDKITGLASFQNNKYFLKVGVEFPSLLPKRLNIIKYKHPIK